MISINQAEKRERLEKISAREAQIVKNLEKLEVWKKDIETRKDKKETVRKFLINFEKNLNFSIFRKRESPRSAKIDLLKKFEDISATRSIHATKDSRKCWKRRKKSKEKH